MLFVGLQKAPRVETLLQRADSGVTATSAAACGSGWSSPRAVEGESPMHSTAHSSLDLRCRHRGNATAAIPRKLPLFVTRQICNLLMTDGYSRRPSFQNKQTRLLSEYDSPSDRFAMIGLHDVLFQSEIDSAIAQRPEKNTSITPKFAADRRLSLNSNALNRKTNIEPICRLYIPGENENGSQRSKL